MHMPHIEYLRVRSLIALPALLLMAQGAPEQGPAGSPVPHAGVAQERAAIAASHAKMDSDWKARTKAEHDKKAADTK